MTWKPHVTVAAIAEKDGHFLMVEENAAAGRVYNQPAGHLDDGEGLLDAVVRETLEETAWHFRPEALTGIYRWRNADSSRTYLRVCFTGQCIHHEQGRPLDPDIVRALWLTADELRADAGRLRSPLVLRSLDDYLAGKRYPLDLLTDL